MIILVIQKIILCHLIFWVSKLLFSIDGKIINASGELFMPDG